MKKIILSICFIFMSLFDKVFATAYLEDDGGLGNKSSFFDNIDSDLIMANWYKFVLIIVAVLCVIGLIVSNVMWFIKKRNKK